jgi:hypothetical protein
MELDELVGTIVLRIARQLERRELVVRDAENSYLSTGPGEDTRSPIASRWAQAQGGGNETASNPVATQGRLKRAKFLAGSRR